MTLNCSLPTPHGDKLRALLVNTKLPVSDRPNVIAAIERYKSWLVEMDEIIGHGDDLVEPLVTCLNCYKSTIDLNLVFDSKEDFLYRQKGQLKLDNTVLEEFLPWFVHRVLADHLSSSDLYLGGL